jgi:small subunit ribosomal protein S21
MIEITVGQNLEKAMRVLKRKLIREGVFKELKSRRFYEKPSEKRKRKEKEAKKKRRKDVDRMRRFAA